MGERLNRPNMVRTLSRRKHYQKEIVFFQNLIFEENSQNFCGHTGVASTFVLVKTLTDCNLCLLKRRPRKSARAKLDVRDEPEG